MCKYLLCMYMYIYIYRYTMCIYILYIIYTHMLSSVDKQHRTVLVLLTSGRLHMAGKKPWSVAKIQQILVIPKQKKLHQNYIPIKRLYYIYISFLLTNWSILSDSIRFYQILSDSIRFYQILSDSIRFYQILSDSIKYYDIYDIYDGYVWYLWCSIDHLWYLWWPKYSSCFSKVLGFPRSICPQWRWSLHPKWQCHLSSFAPPKTRHVTKISDMDNDFMMISWTYHDHIIISMLKSMLNWLNSCRTRRPETVASHFA